MAKFGKIEVPPLRLSDVIRLSKDGTLDKINQEGVIAWEIVVKVVHTAAAAEDRTLTVEQVADSLDLSNAKAALDSALGAAPANPAEPKVGK